MVLIQMEATWCPEWMHLISRYGWMLIPPPSFTSPSPIYTLSPKCSALVMKAEHQDSALPSSITGSPLASSTKVLPHRSPAQQSNLTTWSGTISMTWPSLESHFRGGKGKRKWWGEITSLSILEKRWARGKWMEPLRKGSEAQATGSPGHRKPVRWRWSWDKGQTWSILLWRVVSPDRMKSSDYHSFGAGDGEGPIGGKGTWGQDRLRKVWGVSWVQALIPSLLTQHVTLGLSLPLWPSGGQKSISPLLLPSAPSTVQTALSGVQLQWGQHPAPAGSTFPLVDQLALHPCKGHTVSAYPERMSRKPDAQNGKECSKCCFFLWLCTSCDLCFLMESFN